MPWFSDFTIACLPHRKTTLSAGALGLRMPPLQNWINPEYLCYIWNKWQVWEKLNLRGNNEPSVFSWLIKPFILRYCNSVWNFLAFFRFSNATPVCPPPPPNNPASVKRCPGTSPICGWAFPCPLTCPICGWALPCPSTCPCLRAYWQGKLPGWNIG